MRRLRAEAGRASQPSRQDRAAARGRLIEPTLPDTAEAARLERALLAYIRQEFSAPAGAVVGFTDILIEDAQRHGLDDLLPDLQAIRQAGGQLQALVGGLIEAGLAGNFEGGFDAFRTKLRHDLRTPINAIKGFGEILLEEAEESGRVSLLHDLGKLLEAARQLLAQIDTIAEFGSGIRAFGAPASATIGHVLDAIRPVERDEPAGGSETPSRILVVDDNQSNRDLLARRLLRSGHQVVGVADGASALDLLADEEFDLVLLDLVMPGISGYEVLARLKQDPRLRAIPVIMISALSELDTVVRCIELGAEDYLSKPFEPVLLRARIGASLEKKRLRDREQAFLRQIEAEKEKSEQLLLNILPQSIVDRMRQGESVIADRFAEATILFADIVGFTKLSARLPPGDVVALLNTVFSRFDRMIAERGLEKIKTIGDAYMLAGGLPRGRDDHAAAVAQTALDMLEEVRQAGKAVGETLQMRVGIHTGPVVAGVIGTHKFVYDVWGDTVNVAARLESHGVPDRVHASASTYLALRKTFSFEPRGPLELKGVGMVETYFLTGRR